MWNYAGLYAIDRVSNLAREFTHSINVFRKYSFIEAGHEVRLFSPIFNLSTCSAVIILG